MGVVKFVIIYLPVESLARHQAQPLTTMFIPLIQPLAVNVTLARRTTILNSRFIMGRLLMTACCHIATLKATPSFL